MITKSNLWNFNFGGKKSEIKCVADRTESEVGFIVC